MKRDRLTAILSALFVLTPALCQAMPWSWDMFTQPSHKAQEEQAPPMPAGIVPTKGKPVYIKDRAAAANIKSPFEPTKASIERGEARYNTYCAPCHGDGGKGDGLVGLKYIPPTDLTGEYVQKKPAGDIYFTITYGGMAVMPSYGDSVPPEDRWHIVNYIKHAITKKTANK